MKSRDEVQKQTVTTTKAQKPRFTIEKLEERIAPRGVLAHPGGGGRCAHGACRRG